MKRGVPRNKVEALRRWCDSNLFNDREMAALEYAEAMTISEQRVSDELFKQLKVHFDEDALIELTGLIAFQNMSSKFNSALDIPAQGFCQVPVSE